MECTSFMKFMDEENKENEIMKKEEKESVREEFRRDIGNTICKKRMQKNISQKELGDFLSMDRTSISRYENGEQEISASLLPLISIYCDFSMKEYFNETFDEKICEKFRNIVREMVTHEKRREKNEEKKQGNQSHKKLIEKVYEVDGKREVEKVPSQRTESYNKKMLRAEVRLSAQPFTEQEFQDYLKNEGKYLCPIIDACSEFLDFMKDMKKKETLKNIMCEFVLREGFVKNMDENRTDLKRFYMYYRVQFWHYYSEEDDENYIK